MYTIKPLKEAHRLLFFFFLRLLLHTHSRGWHLSKKNDANIEIDVTKTMCKTATKFSNHEIIFSKTRTLLFTVLKRNPWVPFRDYFCKLKRGLLFKMGFARLSPLGIFFVVLLYTLGCLLLTRLICWPTPTDYTWVSKYGKLYYRF